MKDDFLGVTFKIAATFFGLPHTYIEDITAARNYSVVMMTIMMTTIMTNNEMITKS
jgi:hypothetical protein